MYLILFFTVKTRRWYSKRVLGYPNLVHISFHCRIVRVRNRFILVPQNSASRFYSSWWTVRLLDVFAFGLVIIVRTTYHIFIYLEFCVVLVEHIIPSCQWEFGRLPFNLMVASEHLLLRFLAKTIVSQLSGIGGSNILSLQNRSTNSWSSSVFPYWILKMSSVCFLNFYASMCALKKSLSLQKT